MAKKSKVKLSNNKLVAIIVIAILISAGGSWLTLEALTGRAQEVGGWSNLTVSTLSAIQIPTGYQAIDWGAGNVDPTEDNAHCYTKYGSCDGGNWSITATGNRNIMVENTGNTNINLSVQADKTAYSFIGGTSPVAEFNATVHENDACANCGGTIQGALQNLTGGKEHVICDKMCPAFNDTINVSFYFKIPADAAAGAKGILLNFTAS